MQHSKFFSVFVLSAITLMISVAFIFWGIGPQDNSTVQNVAQIGDTQITLNEYYRAYDIAYKRLRDQKTSPEDIKKLKLEDKVLNNLIDRTVLLIAAENFGISVSEKELQRAIINTPYFQKNGVFNQGVYERALRINRMTTGGFESNMKNDLIIAKMTRIIGETSELSTKELELIDSIKGGNKKELTGAFRSTKTAQTVKAYIEGIKRQLKIEVNSSIIS